MAQRLTKKQSDSCRYLNGLLREAMSNPGPERAMRVLDATLSREHRHMLKDDRFFHTAVDKCAELTAQMNDGTRSAQDVERWKANRYLERIVLVHYGGR